IYQNYAVYSFTESDLSDNTKATVTANTSSIGSPTWTLRTVGGTGAVHHSVASDSDGTNLKIYVNNKESVSAVYAKRMMSLEDGTWVLYPGSSLKFMPELGKVRSVDGAAEINVKIGDKISWEPI
ncbi:MAG: hypothetical protein WCK90_06250, partial [archaeon]